MSIFLFGHGELVRDRATGLTGTVTYRFVGTPNRYSVELAAGEGRSPDVIYIDENFLETAGKPRLSR